MKFCPECECRMVKSTGAGRVQFKCTCLYTIDGDDADTLMSSEHLETNESNLKYDVFIDNSPYDAAGNKIMRQCVCGMPYMTMIRIGITASLVYVCGCGARVVPDTAYVALDGSAKK